MTNGHPTQEEDFDLYALGALEGEQKREIEVHVASCGDCSRRLAEARGRVALLALAAPQVPTSAAVKSRLMSRVREAAANGQPSRALPERAAGLFGRWWTSVLVPAGAALAVASIVLWTENRRLDQQLVALRAEEQQQRQQLQQAREVAGLITASDTMVVALASQPGMPKGTAQVLYNAKMGMLMYEGQLEPAAAEKTYQLWIVPQKGDPISAGVFNPAGDKTSHFLMKLPQGIIPAAFAVTLEPAGGRPQPTGPKVLVGAVS